MRVTFLTHYTNLYGANRSLLNLIDGLRNFDVVPHVIAPDAGDLIYALLERNVPTKVLPLQCWVSFQNFNCDILRKVNRGSRKLYNSAQRLYSNLRLLPELEQQLKNWNTDLIYSNSGVIPIGAWVAKKNRLPHVWHLREFIDLDYSFQYDWGKPFFNYWLHQADAQIAISRSIRSHFFSEPFPKTTHVIYNGVASTHKFEHLYHLNGNSSEKETPYTFALIGFINDNKGQDVAIRAFASLTKRMSCRLRLLIVGDGDSKKLKMLTQELGVADLVEFWGYIDDPYEVYLAADVVLMCSKNEGMGRVTVEAMSACRPVIGFNSTGTSELIEHERTGLLYQNGFEQLSECMQKLVENPTFARQLGENGWRIARNLYTTEAHAFQVYDVLVKTHNRTYATDNTSPHSR